VATKRGHSNGGEKKEEKKRALGISGGRGHNWGEQEQGENDCEVTRESGQPATRHRIYKWKNHGNKLGGAKKYEVLKNHSWTGPASEGGFG